MKNKLLLAAVLSFGLLQVAFGQIPGLPPKSLSEPDDPKLERAGYLIGPGDVITGSVLGEPQFNFTATIDEDGRFQVPFFERPVMAQCKTERELRKHVTQLVSKYLKTPLVSIAVVERKSRPVMSIYGEIRSGSQNIDMRRKARLLEVISFAGGTTEEAGDMVQIFRTQPLMCSENAEDNGFTVAKEGDVPSKMYSLASVKEGVESSNPIIIPGDIIIVPKGAPVYITGEVAQRTGLRLTGKGLSLLQAISMVGGVNPGAKTKDISIYRMKPNSKNTEDREIISVNYDAIKKGKQEDVMLQPYDIVEVDKSKKKVAQIVLETVIGIGRTAAATAGGGITNKILY